MIFKNIKALLKRGMNLKIIGHESEKALIIVIVIAVKNFINKKQAKYIPILSENYVIMPTVRLRR